MSDGDGSLDAPRLLMERLRVSGLGEAATAALASRDARIVRRWPAQKAATLTVVYARRRFFLSGCQTAHAERLRRAMNELIDNLRPLGRMPVDVLDIRYAGGMRFLLFCASPDGPAIGCLPLRLGSALS
jgi:hypothetical protein